MSGDIWKFFFFIESSVQLFAALGFSHMSARTLFSESRKFGEPKIVRRHWRDERRFGFEMDAARCQNFVRALNVRDFEIKYRARMIEIRPFRNREHQSDATAIEERHFRRDSEKVFQAERLFIKHSGARQIVHVN